MWLAQHTAAERRRNVDQDTDSPLPARHSTHRATGLDARELPSAAEGEVFSLDTPFYRTRPGGDFNAASLATKFDWT